MYLIALTFAFLSLPHWTVGDLECGKVAYQQLYRENYNPELEDFPWIGRMFPLKKGLQFQCNGVLVSKRHLIVPAHCVEFYPVNIYFDVPENETDESMPDSVYKILHFVIHPNYNKQKKLNDVALVHLERDVDFADYIQPICLPSASVSIEEFTAQYFQLVGHYREVRDFKRFKGVAHIIPPEECLKDYYPDQIFDNTLCASLVGEHLFSAGSALMGVNFENRTNKTYYLLGILSYGVSANVKEQRYVFARISSYINWIETNIKFWLDFESRETTTEV